MPDDWRTGLDREVEPGTIDTEENYEFGLGQEFYDQMSETFQSNQGKEILADGGPTQEEYDQLGREDPIDRNIFDYTSKAEIPVPDPEDEERI